MRHWSSILRYVMLVHKPSLGTVGSLREHQEEQGLQERGLPAPQGVGREGCTLALGCSGCRDDNFDQGAGRLYWREGRRPLQTRHLQILSSSLFFSIACDLSEHDFFKVQSASESLMPFFFQNKR